MSPQRLKTWWSLPLNRLVLLSFVNHVGYNGGRLAAVLSALKLSNGSSWVGGVVLATLSVVPMLTSLPLGRWADRSDKRVPMRLGSLAIALACVVQVIYPHIITLLISVTLLGSGYNMYQITLQHLIGKATNGVAERTRVFTVFSLAISSSLVFSPLMAGYLIDHFNYRWAFLALGVFPAFAFFILGRWRQRLLSMPAILPEAILPSAMAKQAKPASTWKLLKTPAIFNVLMASLAIATAWDLHSFVIPIIGQHLDLTAASIGTVLAAFSAGTFVVRLIMPWLVAWVQPWQIIHSALVVAILVYLLYPWIDHLQFLIALSFVLGMALGSCQPNLLAMLHDVAPKGRGGELAGFRVMFSYGSGVFVPLIFGALAERFGILPPFLVIVLLLVWARWVTRTHQSDD